MSKMNIDITASAKPEYPVLDRDPPFTRVVGNFNSLDYLRFVAITGVSVTVGYLSGNPSLSLSLTTFSNLFRKFLKLNWTMKCWIIWVWKKIGIKPGIRGPSMVTGGLIGLMGGFMYAYQNSAGRIMGFFPNDGEVARYKKWHHFFFLGFSTSP